MNIRTEIWNGHEIRFVEKGPGDWWAVAKDVAAALGYSKAEHMTRRIKEKHKGTTKWGTPGGEQELTIISEQGTYKAIMNSHKPEAEEFEEWVFSVIKELRRASGLAGFEAFRMTDRGHQVKVMGQLNDSLFKPVQRDFIKANSVANKCVSTMFGHPKMVKKDQMTPDMLKARQPVLEDTVRLMIVNESLDLGLSVSKTVNAKYLHS